MTSQLPSEALIMFPVTPGPLFSRICFVEAMLTSNHYPAGSGGGEHASVTPSLSVRNMQSKVPAHIAGNLDHRLPTRYDLLS